MMKKILVIVYIIAVFISCSKMENGYNGIANTEDVAGVNIIQVARNNPTNLSMFPFTKTAVNFPISVGFGALGYPANDIKVSLSVDMNALDSINNLRSKAGQEIYKIFPSGSYSLDKNTVVIKKNSLISDIATLVYNTTLFDAKLNYMLPISISNASGYKINPNAKTIFITSDRLIEKIYNLQSIVKEINADNEAGGNEIKYVIDGNPSTIWHTPWWSPDQTNFPHWFQMIFKDSAYVTKIAIQPRIDQYNSGFTKYKLEATKDGSSWILLGDNIATDPGNKAPQPFDVPDQYYTGFRLTALTGPAGVQYTSLSEFWIYGYN